MFVRVAHRTGWQVEQFKGAGMVESFTLSTREQALEYAMSLDPDWIEVGDIVGLDTPDQHHAWSTLQRQADGSYAPSPLKWQREEHGRI